MEIPDLIECILGNPSFHDGVVLFCVPLLIGWIADMMFGDPARLPHPVVWFGRLIHIGEKHLNKGNFRFAKGAVMSICLVAGTYAFFYILLYLVGTAGCSDNDIANKILMVVVEAVSIFYCLSGTTLIREVRGVFMAVNSSLEEGRVQVARIVGRDTSELDEEEIKTAALETLAENLSDGVIAPLFWLLLLGVPGMMAYKMINTLDSMIGYHTERYLKFGCFAARLDDVANYVPARLTAFLMLLGVGKLSLLPFVAKFGHCHASPNSGYPEAALAGILNCRFGGSHKYFGEVFYKPYIGNNPKNFSMTDMHIAVSVNRRAEILMVAAMVATMLAVSISW